MAERLTSIRDQDDLQVALEGAPDADLPPAELSDDERVIWRDYCRYYRKRLEVIRGELASPGSTRHRSPRCFSSYCEALGRPRKSEVVEEPPREELPPEARGFKRGVLPAKGSANRGGKPAGLVLAPVEDPVAETAEKPAEKPVARASGAAKKASSPPPVPAPAAKPAAKPAVASPEAKPPVEKTAPERKPEPAPAARATPLIAPRNGSAQGEAGSVAPAKDDSVAGSGAGKGSFGEMATDQILERVEEDIDQLADVAGDGALKVTYPPAHVPAEMRPVLREYAATYGKARWGRPVEVAFEPSL